MPLVVELVESVQYTAHIWLIFSAGARDDGTRIGRGTNADGGQGVGEVGELAAPEEGAATEGADAVALNAYAVALNAE